MTQITEDYVSFETAKLLKEKAFDEDIDLWYDENGERFFKYHYAIHRDWRVLQNQQVYQRPTLQMAMKWLRINYNIFLSIQQHMDMSSVWYIYADGIPRGCDRESHNNSYEQACEAAIKYCLEKLI